MKDPAKGKPLRLFVGRQLLINIELSGGFRGFGRIHSQLTAKYVRGGLLFGL